jgi:hypothetical protein
LLIICVEREARDAGEVSMKGRGISQTETVIQKNRMVIFLLLQSSRMFRREAIKIIGFQENQHFLFHRASYDTRDLSARQGSINFSGS